MVKKNNTGPTGLVFNYTDGQEQYTVQQVTDRDVLKKNNWQKNSVVCPFCKSPTNVTLAETQDSLLVGIKLKNPSGKEFVKSENSFMPPDQVLTEKTQYYIQKYSLQLPSSPIEKWSGIVNPGIYGMETHKDFFNKRQNLVMIILITLLLEEYQKICSETTIETGKYIISLLSGLLDQLIDWNCRLSMWISENEQVGRAFCGPGIPMIWDYNEIDPVSHGPANLWDKLDRIIKAKKSFIKGSIQPHIIQAKAQDIPFEDNYFDLIVTDPPYYDNIFYSVLSNFFYTWKKVLFEKIDPLLFKRQTTTIDGELVSSTYRNVDSTTAHLSYVTNFTKAISEIERVSKEDGLFALIYGHSAIEGWLPILESYQRSNFYITSVQPLRIERLHRPRSMKSNASNSVVVIIARKFSNPKQLMAMPELQIRIDQICTKYIIPLQQAHWSTFEIGIPIFANCISLLANHSKVVDETKKSIELTVLLDIIVEKIQIYLPDFIIKNRKSL